MPLSCSSCAKASKKSSVSKDDTLSCSGCCAPMCDYFQDPKVLEAVGTVKKHCFPAVDAPSQVQSEFGFSLALSPDGTVLVVGAPGYNVGNVQKAGAVFVFERLVSYAFCKDCNDGEFTLVQVLTADVPDDDDDNMSRVNIGNFGQSVAISGDKSRIAIGAPFQDVGPSTESDKDEGAVFIFERKREHDCAPLKYCRVQKVIAQRRTSATDCTVVLDTGKVRFGYRIALSRNGGVLVVTDPAGDVSNSGFVYIYEDCSLGLSFTPCPEKRDPFQFRQRIDQEQVAQDSGYTVAELVAIGNSVATTEDGATIVFGAAFAGSLIQGLVFVYRRCCHEKPWVYCQTVDAGNRSFVLTGFGVAVAITPCGKYLAVEAGGYISTDVFIPSFAIVLREKNGQYFQDGNALEPENLEIDAPADFIFGQRSLAISDNGCVVAVGFELTIVSDVIGVGDVAIFDRKREPTSDGAGCETKWVSRQMLKNPQELNSQTPFFFGTAIAMSASAETLAVSAPSVLDLTFGNNALAFTYRSQFKGRPCAK